MYGLYKTLTTPRNDGLAWRIATDRRTGEWMPSLIVVDIDKAWSCYPQTLLAAINGTSLYIRSMMVARQYNRTNKSDPMLAYIETNTLNKG